LSRRNWRRKGSFNGKWFVATIKDRLTHHAKAVLTAVEVATSESDKLIEGFRNFMTESRKTVKESIKRMF
jgi:hypothetical protein